MKFKGLRIGLFFKLPWIGNILLTYWRFLLIYSFFILFILGITNNLIGYTQFITYLLFSIFPWGFLVGYLLILYLANKELRKCLILLKDYKSIAVLGDIQIIGLTKTALTKQPININTIYIDDQYISVTGQGYEPKGEFVLSSGARYKGKGLIHLLRSLVLSSDTWLVKGNIRVGGWFRRDKQIKLTGPFGDEYFHKYDDWSILGSSIEGAFLATGAKGGIWREELEQYGERLKYIPFDPDRRWSATLFKEASNEEYFYINGDPKVILDACQYIWKYDNWYPLSVWHRKRISATIEEMTGEGLKTLCVAYTEGTNFDIENESIPRNLILLGIIGLEEWPETGINTIIKGLKSDNIEVNLVTGDDYLTVKSFAQTMHININKEWCQLTPDEKGALVKRWSSRGRKTMVLGTKNSDLKLMTNADIAFCYIESENKIKDHAQGLLPRGKLANLVIGLRICKITKNLVKAITNIAIILSIIFGSLILFGKYIFDYLLPWWFWAIINCLIIVGIIVLIKAKRR